jgi:HTH-type transcriptional regulator/antitoxin HigA
MQINFDNEYMPDVVSAPGETLKEILEGRRMTQTDLADRLGLTHKTVNEIIHGKAPLTLETALALETVLGIPASFWNAYEMVYRESLARKEGVQKLSASTSWLDMLPWKKAEEIGWIKPHTSEVDRMMELLRFFGVASPKQYEEVYGNLVVQWKRSPKFVSDPGAAAFWLRRGELAATELAQAPGLVWNEYHPQAFEECLIQIRALTRDRDPESFVPKLQKLCALAGVVVVFIPELPGTRAGGATRWLSPVRALIQLSLRHGMSDNLWFYFFHEAAHVLKHSKKRLFLEYDGKDTHDLLEREADEFAENTLIPPREYSALLRTDKFTKSSVEAFAERIEIDPGIVVGRLQKEKKLPRNYFNDLKQPYKWEFITRG